MIISNQKTDNQSIFEEILSKTKNKMVSESIRKEIEYTNLNSNDIEEIVFDRVVKHAENTIFENTFELKSSTFFPDIYSDKYPYGIEVKTKKSANNWKTNGNSVLETSRIENVDIIYLFFCRLLNPVEIKFDIYQNCIEDVTVTHSPRYLINMEVARKENFFNKINLDYDVLRKSDDPIRKIINYYREITEPGEEVWWMGEQPIIEDIYTKPILTQFTKLEPSQKIIIRNSAFAKFPEILSTKQDKFVRVSSWMVANLGVICRSTRDIFTAGGQKKIEFNGKTYENMPRIFDHFKENIIEICDMVKKFENEDIYYDLILEKRSDSANSLSNWKEQVLLNVQDRADEEYSFIENLLSTIK